MPRWNAPALESLYELAQEFGDVAPLPAFGVPFFLFCHPEHIEEILRQKNRSFKKDRYLDALRPMLGNGLFTSEGETWRRQRAVARPLFAAQQIKEYAGIVVAFADRLIGTWQRGQTRDVHADMMGLSLDITIKTLFDVDAKDTGALGEELDAMTDRYTNPRSVWSSVEGESVPAAAEHLSPRLDALIGDMIRERRTQGNSGRVCLLGRMLEAEDETGQKMTNSELRDQLITYFLAGQETTALALFYTFYLLAENPDAESELETELKNVLADRLPTADDLERLPYTEAVVKESMRIYPPAWAIGREALEDCEIGGHALPKGASFDVAIPRPARPAVLAGAGAVPPCAVERRTDEETAAVRVFSLRRRSAHLHRANLAMMELVLLVATIAQRFRFEPVPGQALYLIPSMTLRPRDAIHMVLH